MYLYLNVYKFGVVEQDLANVLAPLMDENLVWTEATIPKNWSPSVHNFLKYFVYIYRNSAKCFIT